MRRRQTNKAVDTAPEVIEKSTLKAVEFPGMEFATNKELFDYLKLNESNLISLKTSAIKDSYSCSFNYTESNESTVKEIKGLSEGKIAAIINTTNYIDAHNDVHLPSIWKRSVKDQQGRVYYVADHDLKISSVIAFPKDVNMSVNSVTWKELGINIEGKTEALTFVVSKDNIKNDNARTIIDENINIEHSVRMQYVKMFLAINSDAKEDKEFKKKFDKHINSIANKEVALERGYFWGVTEAKIIKEGSMVLFGSNDATPLLHAEDNEPTKVTQEITEPLEDTQKRRRR